MKYIHKERGEMTEDDVRDYLVTEVLTDDYIEDFVDETHEPVKVCGITFGAGAVLHKMDPIAFACVRDDLMDGIMSDLEYGCDGYDISVVDDDGEDEE